jgi:hypothetical protein
MACDPERGLKSFEAARAQEAFAQDKKGPTVADHTDRTGHRTRLFFKGIPSHFLLSNPSGTLYSLESSKGTSAHFPF